MTTSLGWKPVESEVIPIEENAKNEEASAEQNALKGARRTRILLRTLAVIRLLITLWSTVSILHWDKTKGFCMSGGSGGYRHQGAHLEAIEKRLNEEASDNGAASELFRFHRVFFINAFNILSTALLWAGAFMNKKTALPICGILEIMLICRFLLSTGMFRNPSAIWSLIKHANYNKLTIGIYTVILILLLTYCVLLCKAIVQRYKHLDSRDRAKERLVFGENTDKNADKTQLVVRMFAIVRLLISIAATFLILHSHNVHMVCWSYFYEGGFLSPDKPLETIQQRLDSIAGNRIEAPRIYRFNRALTLDSFNIAITVLLWAGAFAKKKNVLPIYAILEVVFLALTAYDYINQPLILWPMLIILLGYCAVFLPMVLLRYYKYLDSRDRARKNLFKGESVIDVGSKTDIQKLLIIDN